jgi:hypothetical protein
VTERTRAAPAARWQCRSRSTAAAGTRRGAGASSRRRAVPARDRRRIRARDRSFDVNLGIVSKWNRNHTASRTFQIPALGAFLLHERNELVTRYFAEGVEAEFFDSDDELLEKCRHYLAHPDERARIAAAGRQRCIDSGYPSRIACARSCPRWKRRSPRAARDRAAERYRLDSRSTATIRAAAPPSQSGGVCPCRTCAPITSRYAAEDAFRLLADEPVGAELDRHRPLGVLAQREARHAEDRRLLLDPARVGEHDARVRDELQEIEVAERIDETQLGLRRDARRQPELDELLARARVDGEDERLSASTTSTRRAASRAPTGSSTFEGLCSVSTAYCAGRARASSSTRDCSARSRWRTSVSIITLPTRWIFSARSPRGAGCRRRSAPCRRAGR